jgi:hypothetical protein
MTITFDVAAFERGTDPILDILTVEQAKTLAAYSADEDLRARIDELATRNTEGMLTDEERAEYEGYVRANNFMSILQAKARKLLRNTSTRESWSLARRP